MTRDNRKQEGAAGTYGEHQSLDKWPLTWENGQSRRSDRVGQNQARRAHNPKVAGSNPAPNTLPLPPQKLSGFRGVCVLWTIEKSTSV